MEQIKSDVTKDVGEREDREQSDTKQTGELKKYPTINQRKTPKPDQWDPPVDHSHLTDDQGDIVNQLLREECHAFVYDEDDIGCIDSLKLHISLQDPTPGEENVHVSPQTTT